MFWFRDWIWYTYWWWSWWQLITWPHSAHLNLLSVRHNRVIWGKNYPKLHCFGPFAGAGPHHQELSRLKPCQFQKTIYWHSECDKLRPGARFQLLAVYCSWTRSHKANEPCLTRLQVPKNGSFDQRWKRLENIYCIIKVWSETYKKISNWLVVGLFHSKKSRFSQDEMRSDSSWLAACSRMVTKRT